MKSQTPKSPSAKDAILALSALAGMTAKQTAEQFAARVQSRRRAFVEQGKLVYHLKSLKLRAGQSVYSILQGQGVPEGSVQQAVVTADLIEALVIPNLLTESRFDEVITHRVARQARRLIQGKAAVKMAATDIAAILLTGESAAIGAELDCLCEHGQTIAARETALAEKAAEEQRLKAAAAEAEKLKAAEAERLKAEAAAQVAADADAEAARLAAETNAANPSPQPDTPDTPPVEIPEEQPATNPSHAPASEPDDEQEQEEEHGADPDAEEQDEEEEEEEEVEEPSAIVIDGTRGGPTPPPAPAPPTLMAITGRFNDLFIESLDLPAGDLEKLVAFLRHSTDELVGALDALKVAA